VLGALGLVSARGGVHSPMFSTDLVLLSLICEPVRLLVEWRINGRLCRAAIATDVGVSGGCWQRAALRATCRVSRNALRYLSDITLYRIGFTVELTKYKIPETVAYHYLLINILKEIFLLCLAKYKCSTFPSSQIRFRPPGFTAMHQAFLCIQNTSAHLASIKKRYQ